MRTARTLHLALGAFLLAPLLIYTLSAILLAHRAWWPVVRITRPSTVTVTATAPRDIAAELMQRGLVKGEIRKIDNQTIRIESATASYNIKCANQTCQILRTSTNPSGTLTLLHRLTKFPWNILLLITSIGLLTAGLTGIYLSLAPPQTRRQNLIILALPSLAALILILTLRL